MPMSGCHYQVVEIAAPTIVTTEDASDDRSCSDDNETAARAARQIARRSIERVSVAEYDAAVPASSDITFE